MKLVVQREVLLEGLQRVQSIVVPKSTIPILANVLFKAEGDSLWLTTTDLEVSVRARVDAKVKSPGSITVPARRAYNLFRELSADNVDIEVDDDDRMSITAGPSDVKLVGLSGDDFPQLPQFDGGNAYALDEGVFKDMLKKVSYAASSDESRYILNGCLLSFKDKKLTTVATDGRRLALVEQDLEFSKQNERDYVVPSKTVNELTRTLADEGALTVHATENQIAFNFSDMVVISKLIEGTYPTFRQVIPADCKERVTVEREGLMNAIRRAALLTTEQSNSVKMVFDNNQLEVMAQTNDVGESTEKIPVKYNGARISISFNPDYVSEPLRSLSSDEIHFELTDDLSPGVIKSDIPFLYVLMPMRIN